MKRLLAIIIFKLLESRLYAWLMIRVIPYIRFSMYYTSFRGWKYQRGYNVIMPGDIILSKDKWKLTSLLIPGEFCHASLFLQKYNEWEVSEMTHNNYCKSTFFDICREATRLVILRCDDWDEFYTKRVIAHCKSLQAAKYDIKFELGVKALDCSELIVASDPENRLKVDYRDALGLGRPYISPMGILNAKNITVVWDSDKP